MPQPDPKLIASPHAARAMVLYTSVLDSPPSLARDLALITCAINTAELLNTDEHPAVLLAAHQMQRLREHGVDVQAIFPGLSELAQELIGACAKMIEQKLAEADAQMPLAKLAAEQREMLAVMQSMGRARNVPSAMLDEATEDVSDLPDLSAFKVDFSAP
jgi:hypothetical protein